jgi:uncharacterized membrane protein YdbT with pleckstrin-like domain
MLNLITGGFMTTPENAPLRQNGYVRKILLSDETLLHQTQIHMIIFAWPTLFALIVLIISAAAFRHVPIQVLLLLLVVAALPLISSYIRRAYSEFAVTNTRVILKTGFLRQTALDIQWKSIGGVSIDQTIFGRIFNYGTIGILGTSAGQKFPLVSDPFTFKRTVEEMMQNNLQRNSH